ncbi:Hypothetical_protein [Hexamita inflata]|uniref:Hypothetical_protein n=1 Tax=Hexamita inflata TaxID=28002 RepID=A0ABP1IZ69_9EUKA
MFIISLKLSRIVPVNAEESGNLELDVILYLIQKCILIIIYDLVEKAIHPADMPISWIDQTSTLEFSTELFHIFNQELSVQAIIAAAYDTYYDQENIMVSIILKFSIVPQSLLLYDNIPAAQLLQSAYDLIIDLYIYIQLMKYLQSYDIAIMPAIQLYQPLIQSCESVTVILSQNIFVQNEYPVTHAMLEDAIILH